MSSLLSQILPALLVNQNQAGILNVAAGLLPANGCGEDLFQRAEVLAPRWIPLWQQMKAVWFQNKELNFCM